ncbi:ATP-grasp enzyme-like protein [Methanosarcina siciliae C2J]|uniref:ATP-grasp enzyme-like protein n=1 Tax=Methanosarcina siciliae C2J TaxID=1434118 RepID=A0A0E3LDX3_9EURY|nr:ATP-grasp domain-containing protein [Methanosarcina siciliae]AKB38021.1 ATP-grasp enzyme-like protein [Methanosarcina siciliae C2J]
MDALITAANSSKALITVRSLGSRGITITTADQHRLFLSSFSKYSNNSFIYPSPNEYPSQFITSLKQVLKKNKYNVLIPVHSEDTYMISKYKSKLEDFVKVPLHDYATISNVNNKAYLMRVAEEIGVRIPRTILPQSLSELDNIVDDIDYPAVIKLRETSSSIGLSYVHSKEEMITKYKETILKFNLKNDQYPLIQEYIEGDGYGVSLLYNQGSMRAKFTHKRLREYPINGGPSTCRVSVKHQKMEKFAEKLLDNFNWHGVAMVEFKLNRKKNEPVLMEINPRFWGSLNQAVQSGVDFPYLLYTMAVEGDIKPVLNYKIGVKTRNTFLDSIAILKTIQKTKKVGLTKELIHFDVKDDLISFNDPIPALAGIYKLVNNKAFWSR